MPGSDLNDSQRHFVSLVSPLLAQAGFRHAFFTRQGGVSEGPFSSLSFSTAVGDDPLHVAENLRRAGEILGVAPERVLYLSQVHGQTAHFFGKGVERAHTITLEGDAIGGGAADSAYGVRTADCVPLLIADQTSGQVMAIHAGWRGVVAGVVEAGVISLRRGSASPGSLLAAIGPHISKQAFEVSEDVARELEAASPARGAVDWQGPKPHVDLRLIVTEKLRALGLAAAAIDQVDGCTVLEPDRFFSFRRDGKRGGRHLSAIVPRR